MDDYLKVRCAVQIEGLSNPISDTKVHIKDIEIASSGDPDDTSSGSLDDAATERSLYILDCGYSHVDDGRVFDVRLNDPLWL